ncbi:hypothetical protein A4A49_51354 [Nicotiana attenuata]|uniref:Uncharacterized protein n=1 Tax=Nicotiana attenuata TaxID=49451 RepID=A0A314L6W5_NICAT|nr:hypothetical protein A4A49_51354 [Nicotiana attenuata]
MSGQRGKSEKRHISEGIPYFLIVDQIQQLLWDWWRGFKEYERNQIKKYLGHLVHMMMIKPRRDDPENNVFCFTNCEMTPTLEEITHFQGWGPNLRRQRPIVPKNMNEGDFLKLLNINYGQYEGLGGKWEDKETWKVHRRFAFMVAFLGRVVFPERERRIDICLAGVVEALISEGDDYTLKELLLTLSAKWITWNYDWFSSKEIICESAYHSYLVLIGLDGVQPYAPLRPHDEEEIMKIWYASKLSELNEMVEDRDRGEGSNRRRNDQRTIERLKEELEHAQMTIAKQQAQQQAGVAQIRLNIEKDYQSALRVMDMDLNHAKNKADLLEEELANTIGLVRRVEAKKNAEIHKLQEDLSIIEEDAHQQQLEFDQQKEQGHQHADFKAERRQWMIEKGVLNRRIEKYERREAQMGHALNTTQIEQVLRLAEKEAYVHDDHRYLKMRKLLPAVFQNLYETLGGEWRPRDADH